MTKETELPAVKVEVENERLRHIVSDCAAALVSGAFISPKASVEFMEGLPKEISLVVSGLRSRIEELEKAVAYESGDPDAINGHRALFKRLHAAESRCEDLVKALEPFSKFAGPVFERNFNNDDPVDTITDSDGEQVTLFARDYFAARAALASHRKASDDLKEAEGVRG
ncbi:hypothetical protein NL154_05435 [Rhizobium sp. YTUHZ044]|uniref:hypothetical protein n=1 Tax=Rhizobium sp. YTUHZ044 TaxID=2962678 RepID=UPI003DA87E17